MSQRVQHEIMLLMLVPNIAIYCALQLIYILTETTPHQYLPFTYKTATSALRGLAANMLPLYATNTPVRESQFEHDGSRNCILLE